MMNPTAFIIDSFKLSWAAILIVIALLVWFCFSAAFYNEKKRRIGTLILILPLAVLFSAFIGRSVYWYSHQSGFHGYLDALKSTDLTAFSLLGILPGIVLACGIVRLLRLDKNLPGLLDCLSPGTASAVAILYLTCLYQPICRGKSIVTAPALLHLPVSFMNYNTQGEPEYRFASFFLGFLLMLVLSFVTASFYFRHRKEKGSTACFFLLFYSAAEFVIESTRYDAGYFPTNGFVSIIQIWSAVCIFGVAVYYTVMRVRKKKWTKACFLPWLGLLLSMGATGFLEYYVQRHGNFAYFLHPLMFLSCFCMALFPLLLGIKKAPAERADTP